MLIRKSRNPNLHASQWRSEIQVFGFLPISLCTWTVYFMWYKWCSSSCCQSSIMLYVPQRDRRIVLCLRTLNCIPRPDYFLLAPWHAIQTLCWFQTTICFRVFLLVWHFVGSSALLPSIPNQPTILECWFQGGTVLGKLWTTRVLNLHWPSQTGGWLQVPWLLQMLWVALERGV